MIFVCAGSAAAPRSRRFGTLKTTTAGRPAGQLCFGESKSAAHKKTRRPCPTSRPTGRTPGKTASCRPVAINLTSAAHILHCANRGKDRYLRRLTQRCEPLPGSEAAAASSAAPSPSLTLLQRPCHGALGIDSVPRPGFHLRTHLVCGLGSAKPYARRGTQIRGDVTCMAAHRPCTIRPRALTSRQVHWRGSWRSAAVPVVGPSHASLFA